MPGAGTVNSQPSCADITDVPTPIPAHESQVASPPGMRFVARQPILTPDEQIFGYELLFRDGLENCFNSSDPDGAARSTLDSSLLLGLDILCDGHHAFVNCTRDVLLKDYAALLPPQQTVIEVLESVVVDADIVASCQRLKQAGYLIALDDFTVDDPRQPLIDLADIVKVDVKALASRQCADLAKRFGAGKRRMLAEKVETRDEFHSARKMGFSYFQGYFFRRPEIMTTHDIPANKLNYVLMLQAVSREELDLRLIENLIKAEVSLCYRLLRYLNSAIFCFSNQIHSIRHALSMLGEREIRRWVQLVAIMGATQQRCSEPVFSALIRARFCELLAPKVRHGGCDLFLMGLFSLMDAILEMPISAILAKIPIDQAIKNVILGDPSHLRTIYRLMLAQESGEWLAAAELCKLLHIGINESAEAYWLATQWAHQVSARG